MINTQFSMGTPMTPEQYAEQWSINSQHFLANGSYDWMSSKVNTCKTILEVGCGAGLSTLSLVRGGCEKVIVIESNKQLALEAEKYLTKNDVSVSINSLAMYNDSNSTVDIIINNIHSNDIEEILKNKTVDGIVCWFIGADPTSIASSMNKEVSELRRDDMASYRIMTHGRCYRLGYNLLKSGGIVSIIDRGGMPDPNQVEEAKVYLQEQHKEMSLNQYTSISVDVKFMNSGFQTSQLQYIAEIKDQPLMPVLNSVTAIK